MDIRSRLTWVAILSLSPLLPLCLRLTYLQVLEHHDINTRASDEIDRIAHDAPPRGDIVDRNGHILAQSRTSWSVYVDKSAARDPAALARTAAPLLGLSSRSITKDLKASAGRFLLLKKGLSRNEIEPLLPLRSKGLGVAAGQNRVYPNDDLARNIIGKVSVDGRGLSGIELEFDGQLAREPEKREIIRDGAGRSIYQGGKVMADKPPAIRLTIDRNFQYYAEKILTEAVERHRADKGLIVVQDPSNGGILAMASHPPTPLRNAAIQDTFEPGSTFKIVTAAAVLAESLVGEEETIPLEGGSWEIAPGIKISDHDPKKELTLRGIISHSSNIGTAKLAERVGATRFYRYCQAFGFLNKTGIHLPGETTGMFRPLSDMTRVSLLAASYGYGVAVSPLQLLGAYSALANGGTLYEPSIVRTGDRPVEVRRIAPERTVRELTSLLEGVVDHGTGVSAQVKGYRIAGKTGTTRKIDPATRKYSTSKYLASFVGFLPVDNPRFTILVLLDEPKGAFYYGSQVAAPVFASLAQRLLTLQGIPPSPPAPSVSPEDTLARAF